jgi:hypothetical protein
VIVLHTVASSIFHSIFRISADSSLALDFEPSFMQSDLFGNCDDDGDALPNQAGDEDNRSPSKSSPKKRKLLSETVGGHQAIR